MSDRPRITIGIPTFNRPERLQRAIHSALGQSVPTKVIVADDGDTDEPERVCREWSDHPHFSYRRSPAKKLWHNWRWVAEQAVEDGAEFFLWLQDDDLIASRLCRRVVRAFGENPDAVVYCSRLAMAYDSNLGCPWVGNWGPKVPQDVLNGSFGTFSGSLLVPVAYFDSWAMSPAKAFRVGPAFTEMLTALPDDCDMFTERLDIATVGVHGKAIVDPNLAGLWIIHGRNESQITTETCKRQVQTAYTYLDGLMDGIHNWREEFFSWLGGLGTPDMLEGLRNNIKDDRSKSPYASQIVDIFEDILRAHGRLKDDAPAAEEKAVTVSFVTRLEDLMRSNPPAGPKERMGYAAILNGARKDAGMPEILIDAVFDPLSDLSLERTDERTSPVAEEVAA